ncbi:hypothetical protein [Candidatus Nesciobacter abundans]|uniref:Uncharacterized protein n=1 Tax=Candidatus Nesciobacter abundans TaxID=2601668 RepID=A0A5C0UJI9_9PROT|nr:hypothetical protein [Candidatus Nesciobacter abundans]QEK38974.1 hypothetical protein FZC36_00795 [Candidatus Nesciobacter abundans]
MDEKQIMKNLEIIMQESIGKNTDSKSISNALKAIDMMLKYKKNNKKANNISLQNLTEEEIDSMIKQLDVQIKNQ